VRSGRGGCCKCIHNLNRRLYTITKKAFCCFVVAAESPKQSPISAHNRISEHNRISAQSKKKMSSHLALRDGVRDEKRPHDLLPLYNWIVLGMSEEGKTSLMTTLFVVDDPILTASIRSGLGF
jgi:hypothetical protein